MCLDKFISLEIADIFTIMQKENEQQKRDPSEKNLLAYYDKIISFITQPISVPIIITAAFYLIIANYYVNFFERLSLPFFTLNLPLDFYLNAGYYLLRFFTDLIILVVFVLTIYYVYLIFWVNSEDKYDKYFFVLALVALVCAPIYFLKAIPISEILDFQTTIAFLLVILGILHWQQYVKKTETEPDKTNAEKIIFIFIFFCVAFTFTYLPQSLGTHAADRLIRGDSANWEAQLHVKDKNISIPNSTLILIVQCNGNYYLAQKSNPVPEVIKLFVIPEDEISMITLIHNPQSVQDTLGTKLANLSSWTYHYANRSYTTFLRPLLSKFLEIVDIDLSRVQESVSYYLNSFNRRSGILRD